LKILGLRISGFGESTAAGSKDHMPAADPPVLKLTTLDHLDNCLPVEPTQAAAGFSNRPQQDLVVVIAT
jgi:hypothetical protein